MTPTSGIPSWSGIWVAQTTPFDPSGEVDFPALRAHARWLVDAGMDGLVAGGSLGEGSSLDAVERLRLVEALVAEVGDRARVIAAVAAARTADAVRQARAAENAGAHGLLVLPPYVYRPDARETLAHFHEVLGSTGLPCMLYNNPAAYGTDVRPEQVVELVEAHPGLTGVKESSGDVRRLTALRHELGDRVELAVGLDDAIVEGIYAGAVGWVAGLANALPRASRELFDRARAGDRGRADEIYRWFLPLLRMDTTVKFVQMIKQVQSEMGRGSPRVRLPRVELSSDELGTVRAAVRDALAHPPTGLRLD